MWDVLNPTIACEMALDLRKNGKYATQDIVQAAISAMPHCGVRDNVSVIAIFLNE